MSNTSFLDIILAEKARELERAKAACPEADMRRRAAARQTPYRGFEAALRRPGVRIVAEIKRASPSKGDLQPGLDPATTARAYAAGGAAALSVLTEPAFFKGSMEDLRAARAAVELPVLRKDFIVDPYQIDEAVAAGADAVLLIVRILDDPTLHDLLQHARDAGIDVLTEIFDAADAARAIAAGAALVGINNRNLATFETDCAHAVTIARLLPATVLPVALSGITSAADVTATVRAGMTRLLVGEALVRSGDPTGTLRAMLSAGGVHD